MFIEDSVEGLRGNRLAAAPPLGLAGQARSDFLTERITFALANRAFTSFSRPKNGDRSYPTKPRAARYMRILLRL
jgi:hypothetical protein